MSTIKLISMYASPWSERVRWAFTFKSVAYEKQDYQPGVDEEEVKKLTGQAQVPVLLADDKVIPDSTAILNWLEDYRPQPALMPTSEQDQAQVVLWEELMDGVLGPQARMLVIGNFLRSGNAELEQGGQFFAQKYGHSAYAEEHANAIVGRILTSLKNILADRQYLVGNTFTRADIATACMLMLVKPAPDDLFAFDKPMRPLYTSQVAQKATLAPVFAWRDEMYRKHRGEAVKP